MTRFESLVDTQAALKRAELRRQVEMEVTRARLLSLQKEKQDNLLRLNQERTRLCEKLEAARELTQQWVRVPGDPPARLARGLRHQRQCLPPLRRTTWVHLLGRYRASRTLGPGLHSMAFWACVLQESRWTEVQNTASEKTLLLGRLRMAVLNLYQLVRLKQGQKQALAVEDIEGQLEEVRYSVCSTHWSTFLFGKAHYWDT